MLKYEAIAHDLKMQIQEGEILPGERFKSVRTLASEYKCSKATILKAFEILRFEHIVYPKANSGFYVADDLLREPCNDQSIMDLATGNPTVDTFSIMEAKHVLNIAVDLYQNNSLEFDIRGVPSLNTLMVEHLEEFDIYCKEENFFLTQGILQTLSILTRMDFPNQRTKILIESPTYSFCNEMMHTLNVDILTIKRDERGLDLVELERIFKNNLIKFFYIVPRNHNPLGTVLSHFQRKEIMRLAHKYDVYIVEDDYFNDAFQIAKYSPLYYFSDFKNCIYLKSYSKLFPYIRIGYVVIPDDLVEAFSIAADASYFMSYHMPDLVSQATLEAAVRSNILKSNALVVSDTLIKKLKILRETCMDWDPDIARLVGGECGYYSSIVLNKKINVDHLITTCEAAKIMITSNLAGFYNPDDFDNSIRISMSRVPTKVVRRAISALYEIIETQYHSSHNS